jgi:hypothetical protein
MGSGRSSEDVTTGVSANGGSVARPPLSTNGSGVGVIVAVGVEVGVSEGIGDGEAVGVHVGGVVSSERTVGVGRVGVELTVGVSVRRTPGVGVTTTACISSASVSHPISPIVTRARMPRTTSPPKKLTSQAFFIASPL